MGVVVIWKAGAFLTPLRVRQLLRVMVERSCIKECNWVQSAVFQHEACHLLHRRIRALGRQLGPDKKFHHAQQISYFHLIHTPEAPAEPNNESLFSKGFSSQAQTSFEVWSMCA